VPAPIGGLVDFHVIPSRRTARLRPVRQSPRVAQVTVLDRRARAADGRTHLYRAQFQGVGARLSLTQRAPAWLAWLGTSVVVLALASIP
jgi:hypothetical protein